MEYAKVYGIDLISHAVGQSEVKEASAQMTVDVLVKEPRVVKESIEICKWFVYEKEVQDMAAVYFTNLCLSPALFDVECWQLKCACYDTTYDH